MRPRAVLAIVAVPLAGATAYAWFSGGSVGRFGIVLALSTLGLVALLLWLTDV